ncbi:MAG: protein kinase [Sandaracinaceae bacterium]|nr:protein kinase [Sandaracinaceae bacterium]
MDLSGQTLLGKYAIDSLLGQGGMAAVWKARHVLTGRVVAIKVLDESYLGNRHVTRRFLREARAASVVAHPGIVEVLDIDEMDQGLPFIVMELLEGETLARRIERRGRLDQEELVRLGAMLLEALEAAHAQGVVHRDLKPENVHVVPAGRRGEIVKILDFGISHMVEEDTQKLTMTGSVLGTPHYMSPEQAMGETEIDHRADLYAAGVVLYECAVGDVPYDAPNYNKLLRRILDEVPQSPRARGATIGAGVERVILWAMEKDRERRIGSAREMLDWLERAAAGEEPPYVPLTPSPPASASSPGHARPSTLPAPNAGELSWEISDELLNSQSGAPPPPPRSVEVEVPKAARMPVEALELDEDALRASIPGRQRTSSSGSIPAVGTSSSSGSYRAPSVPPAPLPAESTAAAPSLVPPRVATLSGAYERATAAPVEPSRPAWFRYAIFAAIALGAFVAVVLLVRSLVEPSAPPAVDPGALVDPDPAPEPDADEPRWVSIRVVGVPPGARMLLDGLPASSPLRLRRGTSHVIEIQAEGYEGRRIELVADQNRTIPAQLRPAIGTVQGGP